MSPAPFYELDNRQSNQKNSTEYSKSSSSNKSQSQILEHAWNLYDLYDTNSIREQNRYKRIQSIILILGISLTVLVLSQSQIELLKKDTVITIYLKFFMENIVYIIIILPITISILVAAATYLKYGNKWVALRSAAESIISEIYQYRTRVGKYKKPKNKINKNNIKDDEIILQKSPEEILSNEIETINNQLMETEVSLSSLQKLVDKDSVTEKEKERQKERLESLSAEQYLELRITEQINFYRDKILKFDSKLKRYQWLMFIIGGIGTFIAAIRIELWIALTSSIASVLAIYIQYNQLENTIVKYNQAATYLENIRIWWSSLTKEEQKKDENIEKLITSAEKVMEAEHSTWQQNMRNAVSNIHKVETESK